MPYEIRNSIIENAHIQTAAIESAEIKNLAITRAKIVNLKTSWTITTEQDRAEAALQAQGLE